MKRRRSLWFGSVAIALAMILTACGSDDSEPASAAPEADTETESASAPDSEETDVVPEGGEVDDRTPEEIAEDQLDLMMVQLGLTDLENIGNCVVERLDAEGIPLTGQGSPELAALVGCDPSVIDNMIEINPAAAEPETVSCLSFELADWIGSIPLADSEAFFQGASPPPELISALAEGCDLAEDEVTSILSQ